MPKPRLFNANDIRMRPWREWKYTTPDGSECVFRKVERWYDEWDKALSWWGELGVRRRLAWAVFRGQYDVVHFDGSSFEVLDTKSEAV